MSEEIPTSSNSDTATGISDGAGSDWHWVARLYERDTPVELTVSGYNRGGLLVEARSLRGFVPISHIIDYQPEQSESERNQILESKVANPIKLKVIELDPERGRLVFSERAALSEAGVRNRLLESLQPGECICGTVTNITPFGVFIDLGGLEGLAHVSELSWGRVRHPEDVVECGQKMEAKVISVNPELGRVALSLKELQPDPWEALDGKYEVGQIVDGMVTNVVEFGAFVSLEEGLEGLVHISELASSSPLHEGDQIQVRILNVDANHRRLGLSTKGIVGY